MTSYKKCFLLLADFRSFSTISMLKSSSLVIVIMISSSFIPSSASGDRVEKEQNLLGSCNACKTSTNNAKTLPRINYIEGFLNGVLNVQTSIFQLC
jgi:hypothetical protein